MVGIDALAVLLLVARPLRALHLCPGLKKRIWEPMIGIPSVLLVFLSHILLLFLSFFSFFLSHIMNLRDEKTRFRGLSCTNQERIPR